MQGYAAVSNSRLAITWHQNPKYKCNAVFISCATTKRTPKLGFDGLATVWRRKFVTTVWRQNFVTKFVTNVKFVAGVTIWWRFENETLFSNRRRCRLWQSFVAKPSWQSFVPKLSPNRQNPTLASTSSWHMKTAWVRDHEIDRDRDETETFITSSACACGG